MTITLTIENVDSLSDGGPLRYQARQHGFEIGREQHLDWTLPDPARYISGRHCEFRYENGAYWLYDVSSNGTFLNGSPNRMKSPYRLAHGDRLIIGHYIVRVELEEDEAAIEDMPAPGSARAAATDRVPSEGDIWDTGVEAPPPANRRDFIPEKERRRAADFSQQFIDFPDIPPPAPHARPPESGSSPRIESASGGVPASGGEGFAGARPNPAGNPFADMPALSEPVSHRPAPLPKTKDVVAAGQSIASASNRDALDALAQGAGVPPETFRGRDPEAVAMEIGEVLRVSIENLTQLLKARAAAKTMTKSASRTMIGAADNNPLKFVPSAGEAIDIMFRRNRSGYMGARQAVEEAFADLKTHELATYAAMQKALARLLDELAPETIEAKVGNAAFPLKKNRAWDLFVARWEAKSANPNGVLDAFLAYFAEAYEEASRKG